MKTRLSRHFRLGLLLTIHCIWLVVGSWRGNLVTCQSITDNRTPRSKLLSYDNLGAIQWTYLLPSDIILKSSLDHFVFKICPRRHIYNVADRGFCYNSDTQGACCHLLSFAPIGKAASKWIRTGTLWLDTCLCQHGYSGVWTMTCHKQRPMSLHSFQLAVARNEVWTSLYTKNKSKIKSHFMLQLNIALIITKLWIEPVVDPGLPMNSICRALTPLYTTLTNRLFPQISHQNEEILAKRQNVSSTP